MNKLRWIFLVSGLAMMVLTSHLKAEPVAAGAPASPSGGVPAKSGIPVINVADYGAVPNDAKDDTAAVTAAINACAGGDTKTLYFPGGTFNLAGMTFPGPVNVVMGNGALLEIKTGGTITFDGPFTAGLYRVFSGAGNAQFGPGAVPEVHPQWWYASGDASPAINKAINSSPRSTGVLVKLIGNFNCQTTIHVNRDRVNLIGTGMYATQMIFNPASPLPLFEFAKPDKSTIVQCAIRDLALFGDGAWNDPARVQKVGIKIVDADIIEVRNIAILNWTGNHSIGLQLQGRDFGYIENISVSADLPISIEKNPNLDWISIDHFVFRNNYLVTTEKDGMAVKLASGIYLTNVVFEGTNSWCGGKYGLYWEDTESKGVSSNLSVKNVRMEQGSASGGEIIHIAHHYTLHNLLLENIYGCSGGVGGVYLRGCTSATLQNIFFTSVDKPVPTALDIDESSSNIVLINAFWNAGLIKTGKLIKTFGTNSNPSKEDNRLIEVYDRPNNPQGQGMVLYGTKTWCYNGELANNTAFTFPVINSLTKVATVTVSATNGSTIIESGTFVLGNGSKSILVAGTSNMAATLTPGKLCLIHGNQPQLANYLGEKVDIVITASWRQ